MLRYYIARILGLIVLLVAGHAFWRHFIRHDPDQIWLVLATIGFPAAIALFLISYDL